MKKEKEILRKQLDLLAKESENCCVGDRELSSITNAMCEIYKLLKGNIAGLAFSALCFTVFANLCVCFFVLVKKVLGGKRR